MHIFIGEDNTVKKEIRLLKRGLHFASLKFKDKAAEGGSMGNALSPLSGAEANDGRQWSRRVEALHHCALLAVVARA